MTQKPIEMHGKSGDIQGDIMWLALKAGTRMKELNFIRPKIDR